MTGTNLRVWTDRAISDLDTFGDRKICETFSLRNKSINFRLKIYRH
jgi:hypothetical protein